MNNAAIQFFNALNPALGGGGMNPAMLGNGQQGAAAMFQSLISTSQFQAVPSLQTQTAGAGMGIVNSGENGAALLSGQNGLLSALPSAPVQIMAQTLGLNAQDLRTNLQTILPQIAQDSPALGVQLEAMLQETATAENPNQALFDALQAWVNDPETIATGQSNPIVENLMRILDGATNLFSDVANMDLDEFKAFKENAFSDIAGFISQPKQVLGPDGRVREFLSGPSFLNPDKGHGASVLLNEYQLSTPIEASDSAANDWLAAFITSPQAQLQAMQSVPAISYTQTAQTSIMPDGDIAAPDMMMQKAFGISASQATAALMGGASQGTINAQGANSAASQSHVTNAFSLVMGAEGTLDAPIEEQSWFKSELSPYRAAKLASNLLMDRATAGRAHPASQGVATAMAHMAASTPAPGEKAMTIFMDPPELGRVEVQMRFGSDKSVKTHMVVEKPETYAMLQRDTHLLNRALNDLGLDTANGSDLTFDLGQGDNFDGTQHDESRNQAFMNNNGMGFEETITLIETEMDVFVDPITGLKHLNMVI